MNAGLKIPASGALDFVSLGALVHRLDTGVIPFRKATHCDIHVSGGEFNVAANLADCFRMNTGVVSAMVDYPIGDLIAERVRAMGVKPFYKTFKHNGVNGPNMATVYSDRGHGVRAPVVFYNRSNEAGALLKPGDFDWSKIFAGGVRWFHSGGIFAALSETTGELIAEGMKAAKAAGAVTSFDLNFRQKLWNIWGGDQKAVEVIGRIVENVDVLVGNEEDLQKGLGIPGPEVSGPKKSGLDPKTFFDMIDKVVAKHPKVQAVATTLREVHTTNRHSWSAVAWIGGQDLYRARSPSSTCSTASAAATASRPASSMGCSRARRPRTRSSSAGRTGRCSRRSPAIQPWPPSRTCGPSPRAVPPAFSDNRFQAGQFGSKRKQQR